jgi:Excalibur calcium-binding domain
MIPSVRLLAILAAAAALVVLLVASLPPAAAARDKDCKDFRTQRAAQIFFLRHGGPRYDPDRLDGDDDGIACEDNPCPCYYGKHLPHRRRMSALPLVRARIA